MGALAKQLEILATMMARLAALELASKETSSVPRYREVDLSVQQYSDAIG